MPNVCQKISAICSSGYSCRPPKTSAGPSCGSGNFRNVKTDCEMILIFPEMQGGSFRKLPEIQQGEAARSCTLAPGSLERQGQTSKPISKTEKERQLSRFRKFPERTSNDSAADIPDGETRQLFRQSAESIATRAA